MSTIAERLNTVNTKLNTILDNTNTQLTNKGKTTVSDISNIPTAISELKNPTGTINITQNGTTDVSNYASANVNVSTPSPTLQSKSVTITDNGTQTVSADSGYDGLSQVEITTNVSGGISGEYALIDYTGITNSNYKYAVRELSDIDLSAQTTCTSAFSGFGFLSQIGKVKTSSSCTNMSSMFANCASLESLDLSQMDTSNVTTIANMFEYSSLLETITFGTSFTLGRIGSTGLRNTFRSCDALSNSTLSNIIDLLATYGGGSNKTLKYIGLSATQASYCETVEGWIDLEDLGWTTGF